MSKETKKNETPSKMATKTNGKTATNDAANETAEAQAAETRAYFLQQMIRQTEELTAEFMQTMEIDLTLTGTDRRRLKGTGVRNNGFIDKAFDIARDNYDFMPAHMDVSALRWNMAELEELRQLMFASPTSWRQQLLQLVANTHLIQADINFRDARRIYNSLHEQSRNRVPGAEPLFRALESFFTQRRRPPRDEPTQKQVERDVKKLLHGKADGRIVIENESPHEDGGVHEVIDDVHSGRSAFKATIEESKEE